jgi:hypothetical protein
VRVTVTEFVTLDGVSQGPGSADEDTTGGFARGGWLVPHLDETFVRQASDWLDLADGLLLGLAACLLAAGLVDTLRLVVAPAIIGDRRQLISRPSGTVGLRLAAHDVTPTGLLLLEYETTGRAPVADYAGISAI